MELVLQMTASVVIFGGPVAGLVALALLAKGGQAIPIGHCARCGYDLCGLSAESRCPECDSEKRSKARRVPWPLFIIVLATAALAASGIVVFVTEFAYGIDSNSGQIGYTAMFAIPAHIVAVLVLYAGLRRQTVTIALSWAIIAYAGSVGLSALAVFDAFVWSEPDPLNGIVIFFLPAIEVCGGGWALLGCYLVVLVYRGYWARRMDG